MGLGVSVISVGESERLKGFRPIEKAHLLCAHVSSKVIRIKGGQCDLHSLKSQ